MICPLELTVTCLSCKLYTALSTRFHSDQCPISDLDDDPARSMVAIAHNILWRKNQIERLVFDGLSMTH